MKGNVKDEYSTYGTKKETQHEMGNAGIPYVILKGCASAFYYPDPSKRLMGDVDFLVKESDLEQAGEILRQEGFVPWEEDHICHVVYRKDVTHLEMLGKMTDFLSSVIGAGAHFLVYFFYRKGGRQYVLSIPWLQGSSAYFGIKYRF